MGSSGTHMARVGMNDCVVLVIIKGATGRTMVMANIAHKQGAAMAKTEAAGRTKNSGRRDLGPRRDPPVSFS